MRLPVMDVRFVPRPEPRARRQKTSDELAVLRAEAPTDSRRERIPARRLSEDDLATGLREPERQRLRVWMSGSPASSPSPGSQGVVDALRREGATRPAFIVEMASAFLHPSTTERLLAP